MDERELIEIYEDDAPGYNPKVFFEGWRVAFLNETVKYSRENIVDMQRHNTSDETFVLLQGDFSLIIGNGDETLGKVQEIKLEPGKMYNVKKGVWHTHVTGPDSKVIIVENLDVSEENTDRIPFSF